MGNDDHVDDDNNNGNVFPQVQLNNSVWVPVALAPAKPAAPGANVVTVTLPQILNDDGKPMTIEYVEYIFSCRPTTITITVGAS